MLHSLLIYGSITNVVPGDYTKILAGEIRSIVPEYSGQVVVQPQLPVEYRLSSDGLATQKEIRMFDGGKYEESFLSTSLQFRIPSVVSIVNFSYIEKKPIIPEETPDNPASTPPVNEHKSPKTAAWPVAKTDGHVAAYWADKRDLYCKLAQDVLDDMPGAACKFQKEFGPTSLAKAITLKVGTKLHRPCSKKDVGKTFTYKTLIQPLLRNPPRKPDNWSELIKGQYGKSLPDILDEIPFEEDYT